MNEYDAVTPGRGGLYWSNLRNVGYYALVFAYSVAWLTPFLFFDVSYQDHPLRWNLLPVVMPLVAWHQLRKPVR